MKNSSKWNHFIFEFLVCFLFSENQRLIHDQEKLIQNLQQDLVRLQKRLIKIETEGIIEPSVMFTRLDAERNEQTLQQAVYTGKVSETTYNVNSRLK
jgi:hypothetical protein